MKDYRLSISRYPVYKDSGFEWLGSIPKHWNLLRIKSITKTKSGTTPKSGTDEYYENGIHFWVRTTDLNNNRLHSSEFKVTTLAIEQNSLSFIQPKSVLLAMYGGMGTIGKNSLLEVEATINQSVCAIFPNHKQFSSEYVWYYTQFFRPHWEIFADSARKDPNINQEAIKRLWVVLPSLPEQKAIAYYLDTKTAQIDRKIDLLTQKAEWYGNLKQSLINETVTRGFDRSVPMKDSGIEWIGEVPEHWVIDRAKSMFNKMSRDITDSDDIITAFRDGQVTLRKNRRTSGFTNALLEHGYQGLRVGDLVIHAMDAFAGAVGVSDSNGKSSPVYSVYIPINPNRVYNPYYGFLIRRMALSGFISSFGKGIRERSSEFRHREFFPLKLPIPPLSEQIAIADYLDTKTAQIDRVIQTINTQIGKLKELRKTLINDVVTGKIKVV